MLHSDIWHAAFYWKSTYIPLVCSFSSLFPVFYTRIMVTISKNTFSRKQKYIGPVFILEYTVTHDRLVTRKQSVNKPQVFFLVDGEICWKAPIWFLLLLYMTQIVYFVAEKCIPYGKYVSIPVLLLLWYFLSSPNIFLKLNILPICLLFYIFGNIFNLIHEKHRFLSPGKNKIILPVCAALLCINLVFGVCLNDSVSFTSAYFGNTTFCLIAATAGVLFYFLLFQNVHILGENRILSYIGRNSLIIMASQYCFFTFYDIFSSKIADVSIWHYRNTLKAFLVCVVTIAFICLITELLIFLGKRSTFIQKIPPFIRHTVITQAPSVRELSALLTEGGFTGIHYDKAEKALSLHPNIIASTIQQIGRENHFSADLYLSFFVKTTDRFLRINQSTILMFISS